MHPFMCSQAGASRIEGSGSIIYMARRIHRVPKGMRRIRYLDDMNLGYKCKSYLSLRSDIGGEDLSSPVGVAANDVSWSLVLAYLSAWTMTLKRMRLTNNISGVGSVAGKDSSIGA
jgi:hypothetical protein